MTAAVDPDEQRDHAEEAANAELLRDQMEDPYPRDLPEDARDTGLDLPSYGD